MGKSTTANFFDLHSDVEIWDADAAVHAIYAAGGTGVEPIKRLCPDCIIDGAVSRPQLKVWIGQNSSRIRKLENIVHPLVADHRAKFVATAKKGILVFDIPLLLESSPETPFDLIVVVSTQAEEQRRRVMERRGMTEDLFSLLLARQMPDEEKRARADVIIATDTLDETQAQVDQLLNCIREDYYA